MSLTLVEAAKLVSGDVVKQTVIELFAQSSDILQVLPFDSIDGNALQYNREHTLPGIAFRGVNESYEESTGVINPQTETLHIAGGDLDVDRFIVKTKGQRARAAHEAMKIKSISGFWTKKFIKGDQQNDPREFDGLQVRLTGDQVINNGTDAGGTALSLAKLDELIDAVEDPQYLLMNKTLRRLLTAAARNPDVSGYITYDVDAFGKRITKYNELPILIADKDNEDNDILAFDEAAYSGDSVCTSIYCMGFGDEKFTGIQNGGIDAYDLGELQSSPCYRTRVEWYNGIALYHPRAAARLRYIKNATVTV